MVIHISCAVRIIKKSGSLISFLISTVHLHNRVIDRLLVIYLKVKNVAENVPGIGSVIPLVVSAIATLV